MFPSTGFFNPVVTFWRTLFFRLLQGFPITDFKRRALYKTFLRLWTFATLKGEYMTVSLNTTLFLIKHFPSFGRGFFNPSNRIQASISVGYPCDKILNHPSLCFLTLVKEHWSSHKINDVLAFDVYELSRLFHIFDINPSSHFLFWPFTNFLQVERCQRSNIYPFLSPSLFSFRMT